MTHRMPRVVISGASGYIGSRLVEIAQREGFDVVVLGSAPKGSPVSSYSWRLSEPVPSVALAGAIAVIHLAHSWESDELHGNSAENNNLSGAEALFGAAHGAGIPRFVFGSSTMAGADAPNVYARVKSAIEERLALLSDEETHVFIARMGFAYGGPERGPYGLLCNLVRRAPLIPVIGSNTPMQLIHVDEIAQGLLKLAADPPRQESETTSARFAIASPKSVTFANWIKLLRVAKTGRSAILIPVPFNLALLYCDVSPFIPVLPTVHRERILGLSNTIQSDSESTITALGLHIRDPSASLGLLRREKRQIILEAAALLSYVQGRRCRSRLAIALLTRAICGRGGRPMGLPRFLLLWPAMIRGFEPIGVDWQHTLGQRLHLATLIIESLTVIYPPRRPNIGRLILEGLFEVAAFPIRALFSRLYA